MAERFAELLRRLDAAKCPAHPCGDGIWESPCPRCYDTLELRPLSGGLIDVRCLSRCSSPDVFDAVQMIAIDFEASAPEAGYERHVSPLEIQLDSWKHRAIRAERRLASHGIAA